MSLSFPHFKIFLIIIIIESRAFISICDCVSVIEASPTLTKLTHCLVTRLAHLTRVDIFYFALFADDAYYLLLTDSVLCLL